MKKKDLRCLLRWPRRGKILAARNSFSSSFGQVVVGPFWNACSDCWCIMLRLIILAYRSLSILTKIKGAYNCTTINTQRCHFCQKFSFEVKWKWMNGHFGYFLLFMNNGIIFMYNGKTNRMGHVSYLFIIFFPISCHWVVTSSCNVLSLYADSHFLPSVDNLRELLNQRWSIETTSFSYSTTLLTQRFDNV